MMEFSKLGVLMVVIMVVIVGGMEGAGLCEMSEDDFRSCRPSLMRPKPVDPSAHCCEVLSGANLTCLCYYRNSILLPYFGIDPELALRLPSKCNLTNPTNC
ncbi:AAI domain-containing protein [Heracleum sosnowskyi]|uniref:AAI domain-containing protein n=1 Tax=Heracleum sosnowskyi TaxID=360622 RepID=A0AAD8GTK5_9APIA|nr:AAI domain-containing protein [Heracleum sosnowskyi]